MDFKKITGVEAACLELGTTVDKEIPAEAKKWLTDDELAGRELKLIIKAVNKIQNGGEIWKVTYGPGSPRKYFPWPWVDTSDGNVAGSGFSDFGCAYGRTHADVGSRLSFFSEEGCRFVFETFKDHYKRMLLTSE